MSAMDEMMVSFAVDRPGVVALLTACCSYYGSVDGNIVNGA